MAYTFYDSITDRCEFLPERLVPPPDEMFDKKPNPKSTLLTDWCPLGLVRGQVVRIGNDVQFYGEKKIPVGTEVKFSRYLYDHAISNFPIRQNAFFRFPDGSERSLTKTSIDVYEIIAKSFPKQGELLHKKVWVCFNPDTSEPVLGQIVRDDAEEPNRMIIKLDDGRFVLSTECQYHMTYPQKRSDN